MADRTTPRGATALGLAALLPLAVAACADPCPAIPVQLPLVRTSVAWSGPGYGSVEVKVGDRPVAMVLDTGFPRSAIALSEAGGLDARTATLLFGGAVATPVPLQLLFAGPGPRGVVGSDVLHQLPLVFDARARTTEVLPAFETPTSEALLGLAESGRCGGGEADRRAPTLYVAGLVEGVPVAFIVDTGAESTFLSSELAAGLVSGPALEGLRVSSGFAGVFSASATRARTVSVGPAVAQNLAVLSSPEVDAELARLTEVAQTAARCDSHASCNPPPRLGGFLGWNYLREFRVSLSEGAAFGERRLGLSRFDTQAHVRRDFVGIGVLTSASVDPPGLRVDAFLSVSPAKGAGIEVGDVIVGVDGRPVADAPSPFGPVGSVVRFTVQRGTWRTEIGATIADLLPDPPPP